MMDWLRKCDNQNDTSAFDLDAHQNDTSEDNPVPKKGFIASRSVWKKEEDKPIEFLSLSYDKSVSHQNNEN